MVEISVYFLICVESPLYPSGKQVSPGCPIFQNFSIVQQPANMLTIDDMYNDFAVDFIKTQAGKLLLVDLVEFPVIMMQKFRHRQLKTNPSSSTMPTITLIFLIMLIRSTPIPP